MTSVLPRSWLPQPRPINPRFSAWLDLLRWAAAFFVCLLHVRSAVLADYSPNLSPAWLAVPAYFFTGFGHQAVVVFFVLSGYLVGGEVLRNLQQQSFVWKTYAIRRLARLYAVYLAALLLGGLWDSLGVFVLHNDLVYAPNPASSHMIYFPVADRLHLTILGWNAVFCQTLLAPSFGSNLPLWSLANEAWYYALFPLLLWPVFTPARMWSRLVCVSLLLAAAWFVRGGILGYFGCWLLGLVPLLLDRALIRTPWIAPAVMLALLGLIRSRWLATVPEIWIDLLLSAIFALWLNTLEHGTVVAPGRAGLHRFLAGFSYSLYLTHWPFALFLTALWQQNFGVGYRMAFSPAALAWGLGLILVVYLYSWSVAQLTERHTPALRGWLLGTARTGIPKP